MDEIKLPSRYLPMDGLSLAVSLSAQTIFYKLGTSDVITQTVKEDCINALYLFGAISGAYAIKIMKNLSQLKKDSKLVTLCEIDTQFENFVWSISNQHHLEPTHVTAFLKSYDDINRHKIKNLDELVKTYLI